MSAEAAPATRQPEPGWEGGLGSVWQPQGGPQCLAYRHFPERWEMFYGGARGGGKTDLLIALAVKHCLRYGKEVRCLIIRTEFKQLRDLQTRAHQIYLPLGASWKGSESCYVFPSGARIYLGHCRTSEDAEKYQGWGINFLGIEEIGNWPNEEPIRKLLGACRSAHGIPVRWIATGNPGGRGHSWVKEEFITNGEPYRKRAVLGPDGEPAEGVDGQPAYRVFIPARVQDNPMLLRSDPGYVARLKRQVGHLAKAWLLGDWDVAPGAYLETVWDPERSVIDDFKEGAPPYWWPRYIAIDWGWAKPYSVGWWTHRPDDGALIRYRERYGWGGRANVGSRETATEVARKILAANALYEPPNAKWLAGVGDASMWNEQGHERGMSIATLIRREGVVIRRGPVGPGTRIPTLQLLVDRMKAGTLLVTRSCRHWLRTVPVIAPDPDHPEDVDTESEDHAIDESRYAAWVWDVLRRPRTAPEGARKGRPKTPRIAGLRIDPRTLQEARDPADAMRVFDGELDA